MENSKGKQKLLSKELIDSIVKEDDPKVIKEILNVEDLKGVTSELNNVLHLAAMYQRDSMTYEILKKCPVLLDEKNKDGNLPVHIAAEVGNVGFLRKCGFLSMKGVTRRPDSYTDQNLMGNPPFHHAIIHNHIYFADYLVQLNPDVLTTVNSLGETPLHIVIKHHHSQKFEDTTPDLFNQINSRVSQLSQAVEDKQNVGIPFSSVGEGMIAMIANLLMIEIERARTLEDSFDDLESSMPSQQRDASGLTPLHTAAYLHPPYNLLVIALIINCCPQSIEVCDSNGKNIFHHLVNRIAYQYKGVEFFDPYESVAFFKNPRLWGLLSQKDESGNTPLAVALKDNDVNLAEIFKSMERDVSKRKFEGLKAKVRLLDEDFYMDEENRGTHSYKDVDDEEGMEKSSMEQMMPNNVFDRIVDNDVRVLRRDNDRYLRGVTSARNNIMHISLRYSENYFVRMVCTDFRDLMWEKNIDGNTPFHIAAEMGNISFVKDFCNEITGEDLSLLSEQNLMGNTALHVALIHNHLELAYILVTKDPSLASIVNTSKEAPLHLVIKQYTDEIFDNNNPNLKLVLNRVEDLSVGYDGKVVELKSGLDITLPDYQMVTMIAVLLMKDNKVACWRDASGLTPLLKAGALLNTAYNIHVIKKLFLRYSPQSVEVCDNSGKNILHYLIHRITDQVDGKWLVQDPKIKGLVNQQDKNGDTPLLMAVINEDVNMVELLTKWGGGNRYINNKEGHNAATLIRQSKTFQTEKIYSISKDDGDAAEHGDVWKIHNNHSHRGGINYYTSSFRDSEGKNLLHKIFLIKWGNAMKPKEFVTITKNIIHVDMMKQTDNNGDTPLHILARLQPHRIKIHVATGIKGSIVPRNDPSLELTEKQLCARSPHYKGYKDYNITSFNYEWTYLKDTTILSDLIDYCAKELAESNEPLLVQNEKGNTAIHEAIINKNDQVLVKLAELYRESSLVNDRKETVLHLLAVLNPTPSIKEEVMNDIIESNSKEKRLWHNVDGLTPLMIAIQARNFGFAAKLCSICPSLAEATDDKNKQTFWHHLVNLPVDGVVSLPLELPDNFFIDETAVLKQLKTKDKEGRTALHLAIKKRRFELAKAFLSQHQTLSSQETPVFRKELLLIQDNEGITPGELVGELPYVPPEFEDFMGEASTMIGIRSIWGIPSTEIKGYVNTMGVIAALLTTITFTAAFTVPGGLDQEKGFPLLIQDTSFQVFMISNLIAMCLSMMVLFCLLWIMAIGIKSQSVVLLDFSIILLLGSFYATLVTFMAGLYATTHTLKPWIAIVAIILCSLLILLMHKYFVTKWIIPSGRVVLIYFDKAFKNARKWGKKSMRYVKKSRPRSELPISRGDDTSRGN